jgi:CRP-like cAMP-binding protein
MPANNVHAVTAGKRTSSVEISWRTTSLLAPQNSMRVASNSILSTAAIDNFSRPQPRSDFELESCIDPEADEERARVIFDAGLQDAVSTGGVLADPPPKVGIGSIDSSSVHFKLEYFMDPCRGRPGKLCHVVLSHLRHYSRHAGLAPAREKVESFAMPNPNREIEHDDYRRTRLRQIALFRCLDEVCYLSLAAAMQLRHFGAGDVVIRLGDVGASMSVLIEGLLDVVMPSRDGGAEIRVAHLRPGDFFGEMSLLTGEPRSATVVARTAAVAFEVTKEHIAPLLANHPKMAESMSSIVAERQFANRRQQDVEMEIHEEPVKALSDQILDGMRRFFGLGLKAS